MTIQNRRDTAANWTSNDPTLAAGEIGWASDTGNYKIGDGSTAWTSLAWTIPAPQIVTLLVFDDSEDVATGDGAGDLFFPVPETLDGFDLTGVKAYHQTAGTGAGSDTTDIQIHNVTDTADMLSTVLTIDEDETSSATAAAAAVINTATDDVATGDILRIDVDALVTGTAPKGLIVELKFELPA